MPHPGAVPYEPSDAEIRTALAALAAVPGAETGALLFARVDLVLDASGSPVVLELELIEPHLFLDTAPHGPSRLAEAVAAAHQA